MYKTITILLFFSVWLFFTLNAEHPHTIFHQGVIVNNDGSPIEDGLYEITFGIFDSETSGDQLWSEMHTVMVVNGILNVQLGTEVSLEIPFDRKYWIGIAIDGGEELLPRLPLSGVPYAFHALSVRDGSITTGKIMDAAISTDKIEDGAITGEKLNPDIDITTTGSMEAASFIGDGSLLSGVQANEVADGSVTTGKIADGAVTQDKLHPDVSLPISGEAGGDLMGNYPQPELAEGAVTTDKISDGAVTADKLSDSYILLEGVSDAMDGYATTGIFGEGVIPVEGAGSRLMWYPGKAAFRVGHVSGSQWDDDNMGQYSVALGRNNTSSGISSVVGGGQTNTAMGISSTIGGGQSNTTDNFASTVGGGMLNTAGANNSTVAGGQQNFATGHTSTIGGGIFNRSTGSYATVPGGYENHARGEYSFAAGYKARAVHNGSFVWNDRSVIFGNDSLLTTGPNQFIIRAAGGVGIGTNAPRQQLSVGGFLDLYSGGTNSPTRPSIRASSANNLIINAHGGGAVYFNHDGGSGEVRFHNGTPNTVSMFLTSGGSLGIGTMSPTERLHVAGRVRATQFVTSSDARYKLQVRDVGNALPRVLQLRGVMYEWDETGHPGNQFGSGTQIGFLAQEVREILPDLVTEDAEGMLAVSYGEIIPLLVEAIKEQQVEKQEMLERLLRLEQLVERFAME